MGLKINSEHAFSKRLIFICMLTGMMILSSCREQFPETTSPIEKFSQLQELFIDPPADYRSAPLWDWNHRISKEGIDFHMEKFKEAVRKSTDFLESNGPQLMAEVCIDENEMRAHGIQVHRDSESILTHWQLSDPYMRDVMQYITGFCGVLEPATGVFTYVNAGHNPPYLVKAAAGEGEELMELREGGIPLGMMPSAPYASGTVTLEKGDLLFMFTDGVTEVMNEAEELMGEEALETILRNTIGLPLPTVLHEVQVEVRAFSGETPFDDDVTMVGLMRLP